MVIPRIELFWWVRVGQTHRFHVIHELDGKQGFYTGCGIYHPMSLLLRAGTIVSPTRPVDLEDELCRRCRQIAYDPVD
jgi:hypothetical protein